MIVKMKDCIPMIKMVVFEVAIGGGLIDGVDFSQILSPLESPANDLETNYSCSLDIAYP
jgi:hypothetical protein